MYCTYKPNIETHSCNHYQRGKAISITYSKCVSVALTIQHAIHKCHIIFISVASQAVPYFSTLSHKRQDSWKKVTKHKTCILIFPTTLSKYFLILKRIEQNIIITAHRSSH
jgi:hypothetical protein